MHCNTHNIEEGNTDYADKPKHCNMLLHTATHCNTLQHTATHCNTLQHTTTHCNTLQHTATHCNTLQTHCSTEEGNMDYADKQKLMHYYTRRYPLGAMSKVCPMTHVCDMTHM